MSQYVRNIYTYAQKAHYNIPGELKQTPSIKKLRTSLHTTRRDGQKPTYYKAQAVSLTLTVIAFIQKLLNHDPRRACTPAAASVLSIRTRRGPPPALVLPRAAANNRLAAPPIRPASAAGS